MFEKLIASVMNNALGGFIENLDSKNLSIGLLSGIVELNNIKVRQDLFDILPVPFHLKYGNVGKIRVDIPYTSFYSSPLKVEIENVVLAITPKPFNLWKEEVEIQNFVKSTMDKLEA